MPAAGDIPHRQGAVAARRRGAGLPQRPRRRSAARPAIGSIVHGTTVGTNTLLERRGPQDRRHHHARLSRRAGDAPPRPPPHLGPVGRFRPDRRPRHAARGRRAHARRRHDPHAGRSRGGPRGGAELLASRARRRSRSSSSTPTPMPATSAALLAARAVWPNEHVTASHEVLPEIREFERASTTALNAYLQPVVGRYLGKLEGGAGRRRASPASSISCSRTAASCRPRRRAGCRCAPRCPVRPPAWSPPRRIARAAGFDNVITCDLGGTSFDVSADRRRQGLARGADHHRFRPGDPHADDRDHHHRRRRRLDRRGRSRRPAAGRAGKRRLGAGPGLLRRRATTGRR